MRFFPLRSLLVPAICVAVAFSSCRIVYTPNNQNVPMMREKGELHINAGTRNLQAAYAVSENVAVMANGQLGSDRWDVTGLRDEIGTVDWTSSRFLAEAGAGYFYPFDKYGTAEVYGGAGYGQVKIEQTTRDIVTNNPVILRSYQTNMLKLFVQPSVSMTSNFADFGFSTRFVGLSFSGIDTTGYSYGALIGDQLADLDRSMFVFAEPAVTMRLGYRYVKLNTQLGYSIKLTDQRINYQPFIFTMGIQFSLAPRYKEPLVPAGG